MPSSQEAHHETIAITGASGKLGGATLSALLDLYKQQQQQQQQQQESHASSPSSNLPLPFPIPPPSNLVALTSSLPGSATWARLSRLGDGNVQVRHASFSDPESFRVALRGGGGGGGGGGGSRVTRLFLVSTPAIEMDYGDAPEWQGREAHHKVAIDAAVECGVERLYYSSLAFGWDGARARGGGKEKSDQWWTDGPGVGAASRAGVMRAHLRTEAYLRSLATTTTTTGLKATVLREGLYNESWPLYLGYYFSSPPPPSPPPTTLPDRGDGGPRHTRRRTVVKLAADGKICWTAISDLGLASALALLDVVPPPPSSAPASSSPIIITTSPTYYPNRTLYLSTSPRNAHSLSDVARMVSSAAAAAAAERAGTEDPEDVKVEMLPSTRDHVEHYVNEWGLDRAAVEWWAGTYEALARGECLVNDPTLEALLRVVGRDRTPVAMEDTVVEMMGGVMGG